MDVFSRRGIPRFPSGDGAPLPARVEVAVIGGGLTGVLTALGLIRRGYNAVVFEAREIGCGAGGACLGSMGLGGIPLSRLAKAGGSAYVSLYAHMSATALRACERLCRELQLRTAPERRPSVLYTRRDEQTLLDEAEIARQAGIRVEMKRRCELPFPIRLALSYPCQASMDPLLFLMGTATEVPLYAGVRIRCAQGDRLLTDEGDEIQAEAVVYACRTPSDEMLLTPLQRLSFLHAHACALKHTPPMHGMYRGIDGDGMRAITQKSTLLLAAPRASLVREYAEAYTPLAARSAGWELWDAVTSDGIPLIGKLSPGRYIATGYGGCGLTHAMMAAELLTALIDGDVHPATALFHPRRDQTNTSAAPTAAHA